MNYARFDAAMHAAVALGHGLREERYARIAARRAFVEMKDCFLRAGAEIDGPQAQRLMHSVRQSREAADLWRLRDDMLASLPADDARCATHRFELYRQLESIHHIVADDSGWAAL